MRWVHVEYLLKGVFLGLLAYAAYVVPTPSAALTVAVCLLAGLAAGLAVAAIRQLRAGIRPRGRLLPYLLFLLLEHPHQIYGGTLTALIAGIMLTQPGESQPALFGWFLAAGALAGVNLAALRLIRSRWARFGVALASGCLVVTAVLIALDRRPEALPDPQAFGMYLLLGLPFYYLLTFAGEAEETEADVAAWCTALAAGVWLVQVTPGIPSLAFIIPLAVYYVYTTRVLPGLRVFKHTLRGMSFARIGRPRDALASLQRAVQLDPTSRFARATLWDVHRGLDPGAMTGELESLVDPDLCLDRVCGLLADPPTAAQAAEAKHLLSLVERRQPALAAPVAYWRAVAALHAKDLDQAAGYLTRLLDPAAWHTGDPARRGILFSAWNLALVLHPGLAARVGTPQLALPGRRLEAIDAVENVLDENPTDSAAWVLKRVLYAPLTETEFQAGPLGRFDPAYAEQLGLALIAQPDRVHRSAEFFAMAARTLPAEAPRLWMQAAEALKMAGDDPTDALQSAKRSGLAAGVGHLSDPARHAFFAAVRKLAEDAAAAGDLDAAAEGLQLYADYERSGVDTVKALADVHARRGDALAALRTNEQALLYNPKDNDLLTRRDSYYYSVTPDQVRQAAEHLRQAVNVDYCLDKGRQLVDLRDADAELLDWARRLALLAGALRPRDFAPRVLLARVFLRFGQRDQALQLLEDVREEKPERFAGTAEEGAWMMACRLLGDLYLNELDRPDLAVDCFLEYRRSEKSGADTLYKLARAYEQIGEPAKAAKFYRQVVSYDNHPLAPDADAGLRRVTAG